MNEKWIILEIGIQQLKHKLHHSLSFGKLATHNKIKQEHKTNFYINNEISKDEDENGKLETSLPCRR